MEQISKYLTGIGYVTEQQGGIVKYLVIFKDDIPIGFLLPDGTLSLTDKIYEEQLKVVIDFVEEFKGCETSASGKEYIIAKYINSILTAYFDIKTSSVQYVVYVADEKGEVESSVYADKYEAKFNFVISSKMLDASELKKPSSSMRNKMLDKMIGYLSNKKNAVQA